MRLLAGSSAAAFQITCLELEVPEVPLRDVMRDFKPTLFPNLTEVAIYLGGESLELYGSEKAEKLMKSAIAYFYAAKKLKVLRVCDTCWYCPVKTALVDFEFPPALEIFGWHESPRSTSGSSPSSRPRDNS